MTWRRATYEEREDIRVEQFVLNHAENSGSIIEFQPRLALKEAWLFGFIPELPKGYIEADRATRRPVHGRLTPQKLRQLVLGKKILPGHVIQLEEGMCWDVAPDHIAIVQKIGIQSKGKMVVADDMGEVLRFLQQQADPFIVAEFPKHIMKNGESWTYPMDPRFLRYVDGNLYYTPVAKDGWFPDQYLDDEQSNTEWW